MNKSIGQIKAEFEAAEEETLPLLFAEYADDARSGVQNLLVRYRKKLEKLSAERERLRQMRQFENAYGQFDYICGIDEVGRGPLAGPVVAGAVILPKDCDILWINDSKKLSAGKREELYTEIQ